MKVTLLVPTLNEKNGMQEIMPKIKKEWYDQLIVIDGGSTDGTIEYCKEKGYPVIIQKRKGLRYAYIEVMPYVNGDVVIAFSPDGNSIPEVIPLLVKKMQEGYDMVIASRYAGVAKSYDDSLITSFGNWMFTSLINLFYGAKYTDAMNMFRAFKKNIIYDLDLDKDISYCREETLFNTTVCIIPLLSIRSAKRKLKIAEIPADEPPRLGGMRKLQIFRWGGVYLIQLFREIFFWK